MKKLYFVRHGESESNIELTIQDGVSPLTELGKKQSGMLAERVAKLPIDLIISSDFVRTKQTTMMISKLMDKPVIFSPLLRELKRPTEFLNQKFDSDPVKKMLQELVDHADDPNWHYSDEENFHDLKKRAQDLLSFINERKEENILLVSHGNFARMVFLVMMLGEAVTPDLFFHCIHFLGITNTGITIYTQKVDHWKILTWNDHAHLAE